MSKIIRFNGRRIDLGRITNLKLVEVFKERVHDGNRFLFFHKDNYTEEHTDRSKRNYDDYSDHSEYGDHHDHKDGHRDYDKYYDRHNDRGEGHTDKFGKFHFNRDDHTDHGGVPRFHRDSARGIGRSHEDHGGHKKNKHTDDHTDKTK